MERQPTTHTGAVGLRRPLGLGRRLREGVLRPAVGNGSADTPGGEADAVHDAAVPGSQGHQEGGHHLQARSAFPKHGSLRRHSLRKEATLSSERGASDSDVRRRGAGN